MENKKIDFATRQLMRSSSRGYLATNMSENLKKKTSLEIEHIILLILIYLIVVCL